MTVALQALTLLNDPMFVEVSRELGSRALAAGRDDAARLRELGRRLLAREFAGEESAALVRFLAAQRGRIAAGALDAATLAGSAGPDVAERAAWTLLARAIMNLDETVVKR